MDLSKTLLFFAILIFSSCNNNKKKVTYARIIRDATTTNQVFYPDGKLKLLITNRKGVLFNIEYFNHKGSWDSVVDYKKGIRIRVVRYNYNPDSSYQRSVFQNEHFSLLQNFDKQHTLIYQEPVNTNTLSKTKIIFPGKKNYLSRSLPDTFDIVNSLLPPENRGYKFVGFTPHHLKDNYTKFITTPSDINGKDAVLILLYLHEKNERKQLLDTISIPLK